MIKNYFRIAVRNLFRHKGYAMLNIAGLAIGIALCLVILRYVQFEQSFDQFNTDAAHTVRVESIVQAPSGKEQWAHTPRDLAAYLAATYPEIESVVRIGSEDEPLVRVGDRRFYETDFHYADASIFDVLDVHLVRGVMADLERPYTVMLTHAMASRYFGDADPIGQTVDVSDKWEASVYTFEVVGIIDALPANSHVSINFMASLATLDALYEDINSQVVHTYVRLNNDASVDAFIEKLHNLTETTQLPWLGESRQLTGTPLLDIHLYSNTNPATDIELQGDIKVVYLFSLTALLVIILACINYANLATARASSRAMEVGVRKVVGAGRRQLIIQFLAESFVFVLVALGLGVLLSQLALPYFYGLLAREFVFDWLNPEFLIAVGIGTLAIVLVAGSYPAFLLSGFRPIRIIKGFDNARGGVSLRKGLVVFQFVVSIGFIAATLTIYHQLNYVTSERLGFAQDQRLILETRNRLTENAPAFKEALEAVAGVQRVSMSSGLPGHPSAISFFQRSAFEDARGNPDDYVVFDHVWADHNFLQTFDIPVLQGRSFSRDFASDATTAVLVNEAALAAVGWQDAVGKTFIRNDTQWEIIGVVPDFHLHDLKQEVRPLLLQLDESTTFVTLELASDRNAAGLAAIEALWNEHIPAYPFQYAFLDDEIASMYQEERRLGQLFMVFSGLAVLVACLGLFGLAAYTTVQRSKEISIRKILGASVRNLVTMLTEDYLKLVGIAFLVAAPLTYFLMASWLESFVYHIELGIWIFLLAGLIASGIAIITVGYQSIKAAIANPVESLRQS